MYYNTIILAAYYAIEYYPIWYATLARLAAILEIGYGLKVGMFIDVLPIFYNININVYLFIIFLLLHDLMEQLRNNNNYCY